MASSFGSSLFGQKDYSEDASLVPDLDAASDLGRRVMRDIAEATGMHQAQKSESEPMFRLYAGDQWDALDRSRMEQMKRPALVFNEIQPVINAISGLERLNRMDCAYKTRALDSSTQEDMAGDLATEARSAMMELCAGENERSRAIKDMSVGGIGFLECKVSFDNNMDGDVILEYVPWEECWYDAHSRKENLEDSMWRARVRTYSRKHFRKLFGKEALAKVDTAAPGDWEERRVGKYELVTPYYSRANELSNPGVGGPSAGDNQIQVIQHQRKEFEPVYRYVDPQNPDQLAEMDDDSWSRLQRKYELLGMPVPQAVRQLKPVFKQCIVSRGVVLEDDVTLPGNNFSLMAITGQWDSEKRVWYGAVRSMKDAQQMKNKSVSSALAFYITNAKGGVMFKTSSFADPNYAKEQWSKPDAWIELNDTADPARDVINRQPSQMPGEIGMFVQLADEAIRTTSGITEEMIGIAQGEVPGTTQQGRIKGGLAVLGWFFDSIQRHMRTEARVGLEFIREFWTRGQLIQVGGPQHSQVIPLLRDALPSPLAYELVVDESVRHNPNLKAQIWSDLLPIMPSLMRFGLGRFLLTALKYSPLPTQLVQELQKEAQQMAQNPPPPKPGRGQGGGMMKPPEAPQLVAAKVQKMSADAEKARAQARAFDMKHQLDAAKLVVEGTLGAADVQTKRQQAEHKRQQMHMKTVADMVRQAQSNIAGGPEDVTQPEMAPAMLPAGVQQQ